MDEFLRELSVTEITLGATGVVALIAFLIFIAQPAWASYGRLWERAAAGFLSVYIGATLLGVGVAAGIGVFALYVEFVSN
jgi:hypothetical protein